VDLWTLMQVKFDYVRVRLGVIIYIITHF